MVDAHARTRLRRPRSGVLAVCDRQRAEQLLDRPARRLGDGAAEADHGAGRHVPAVEMSHERLARGRAHGLGRADDVAAERCVAVAEPVVDTGQVAGRRVEVHVHLLDDHSLLALDLRGIEQGVQQHVAEHVDCDRDVLTGALDVVARVLLAREGIELGADAVDLRGDVARGRPALRALEEEVLGEMRDAAGVGVLVARADGVHDHDARRLRLGLRGGQQAGSVGEMLKFEHARTVVHYRAQPCESSSAAARSATPGA